MIPVIQHEVRPAKKIERVRVARRTITLFFKHGNRLVYAPRRQQLFGRSGAEQRLHKQKERKR